MRHLHKALWTVAVVLMAMLLKSCIEPPLHLPGQEILTEVPIVETKLEVVWNIETEWTTQWHYGWDVKDDSIWGGIGYEHPEKFQVRRYFTGDDPDAAHSEVDAFSINDTSFRRFFQFGFYDILLWSDINSKDGTQVLVINETLDEVTATTTGTRGLSRSISRLVGSEEVEDTTAVVGLFNQPEVFFATYPEDVYISRDLNDYVYDPVENVYIKKIEAELKPLVYIYLVQIILVNNDGRIKGINGNAAMSSMASGVNVNTGHTNNSPSIVYFNTRLKHDVDVNGALCDVIGGKFTTFGLCDMEPYTRQGNIYSGSRTELNNFLFFDLLYSNDGVKTYSVDVTDQMQKQAHGGVVTIYIDCSKLTPPEEPEKGKGSLFVPTVEDYMDVYWEIEL
ncbi:MAG: hypothetical protein K5856_02730 [Bacteroidaceae bacterium]|nr:hypothetical protein [Bacteroidaceae bacterium]